MSTTTTQQEQKRPSRRDPKDPDVMVWLERERYVTLAYQFLQQDSGSNAATTKRRLFQQDTDEFRDDVMLHPIIKVRFAGVIYRPREEALPPSLKEFKRTHATIRALHHDSAKQRFANHPLMGEINLMPFLKKLLAYREAERLHQETQERFKVGLLEKRPSTFKLCKPLLSEYLRVNLRKLLVHGCYKPRNQETYLARKKAREELHKMPELVVLSSDQEWGSAPTASQSNW